MSKKAGPRTPEAIAGSIARWPRILQKMAAEMPHRKKPKDATGNA